ncbi:hypothetical protein D3C87_873310 [compost metagenome]
MRQSRQESQDHHRVIIIGQSRQSVEDGEGNHQENQNSFRRKLCGVSYQDWRANNHACCIRRNEMSSLGNRDVQRFCYVGQKCHNYEFCSPNCQSAKCQRKYSLIHFAKVFILKWKAKFCGFKISNGIIKLNYCLNWVNNYI